MYVRNMPLIKNKLFLFGNYEGITRTEPGTTWISAGSPLTGTQVSRVKYSDMETLSRFMKEKFDYTTGPWEGYSNSNTSNKFLIRADWNINDKNKLTARYVHHNSEAEIIANGRPSPAKLLNAMSNPQTLESLKLVGLVPKETILLEQSDIIDALKLNNINEPKLIE